MSTGHGGARSGAGRKRKAESEMSQGEPSAHVGPGRPRKSDLPRTGGLMSGTGV